MCNLACLDFGKRELTKEDIQDKTCIEVGSMNVNGSLRSLIQDLHPQSYIGVDISNGIGVDEICDTNHLIERFGKNAFDLVINTEMLEHIQDWRSAISNLKGILKPDGVLLITTRSLGFPYHGYPFDFWRYELEDMRHLFSDMIIESLEVDPSMPGVFIKAKKTANFSENTLQDYQLYSIIKLRRCRNITNHDIRLFKLKTSIKNQVKKILKRT